MVMPSADALECNVATSRGMAPNGAVLTFWGNFGGTQSLPPFLRSARPGTNTSDAAATMSVEQAISGY